MRISGTTFLVSGGGSGLGAATVRRLLAQGGRAVIADLNEEAGMALAEELGDAVRFVPTDVTDERQVQRAVDAAVEHAGPAGLRGAVSCAGIAPGAKIRGREGPHPLDVFKKSIDVNLVGTFNLTRLAIDAIAETEPDDEGERGVVVNTASVAAFEGQIGQAAYAAAKGGVASMTLPIARETAKLGIRVAAIAPGVFDTPLMAGLPEKVRAALDEQTLHPPRLGRPDEYASLVQQIIENAMLNGCVLRLDGAVRLPPR